MAGRPTKLDQRTADMIISLIEGGVPRERAARAAGIAKSTLQLWIARGRAAETIDPDDHTLKELRTIARDREVDLTGLRRKADIAAAINDDPNPYSDFSDRVDAADSRFMASAIGKMRETGSEDWRMWDRLLERRFPELRVAKDAAAFEEPEAVGTEADAERKLERAEEIRVKMLGTGTDG